jgi:flagellar protein FlbD
MIRITRLNGVPIVLNSDLIQHIENTPDTVITLISGEKLMVLESTNEIVEEVVRYRRKILAVSRQLTESSAAEVPGGRGVSA